MDNKQKYKKGLIKDRQKKDGFSGFTIKWRKEGSEERKSENAAAAKKKPLESRYKIKGRDKYISFIQNPRNSWL